jgi:hypothetical protein
MTEKNAVSDAKTPGWITAFQSEPPLHTLFPVYLVNGKSVPGVHIVCSKCGGRISGDRVRGRVVQSLPHVVTVAANGWCEECDRMTHIDCRFRSNADETVVEWLASGGYWQAKEMRQPTIAEKIARGALRLAAWVASAL